MGNQTFNQVPQEELLSSSQKFNKNETDMFACFDNKNDKKNQKIFYQLMSTQFNKLFTDKKQMSCWEKTFLSRENIQKQYQLNFQYVLKENQSQKNKNYILQQENKNLKKQLKLQKEKVEDLKKDLQNFQIKVENLEIKIKSLEDTNSNLSKLKFQMQIQAEEKISQLNEQVTKLNKTNIKSENKIKYFKGRIKKLKIEAKVWFYQQKHIYQDNPEKLIFVITKFMDRFFTSGETILKYLTKYLYQSKQHVKIYKRFQKFIYEVSISIDKRLLSRWKQYLKAQKYKWISICFQRINQDYNNSFIPLFKTQKRGYAQDGVTQN